MMKPYKIQLLSEDNKVIETKSYACSECKRVAYSYQEAMDCCSPKKCSCGTEIDKQHYNLCEKCRQKEQEKTELNRWEKMELVEYNGEPIYFNDEFYADQESFFDICEDITRATVQLCETNQLGYNTSPECLIEDIAERLGEEIEDFESDVIAGQDELFSALKTFLECQTHTIWTPVNKKSFIKRGEE